MMISLAIIAALACLGWCLYVRRISWHCRGERPITVAVGLMSLSIVMLVPPLSVPLNNIGHLLTGTWNLQGLIAHGLCLAADGAIVYHLAWRAQNDDEFQRGFKTWVQIPATLAFALMFACWLRGNGSKAPVTCFYLIPVDLAMRIYWAVLCAALAWMMSYALRWMFVLRQDPRSRPILNVYIFAGISGLIALLFRAVESTVTTLNSPAGMMVASTFGCAAVIGFAVGGAVSWSRKRSWFHPKPLVIPEPRPRYLPRADVSPF